MSSRKTAREIADQASEWATRIDAGSIDASDEGLRQWIDSDPRHSGALLRAEAALSLLDRARALAGVIPKPSPPPFWIRRKLIFAAGALAAGIAAVVILTSGTHRYGTALGEIRQVALSDGSAIAINTQSLIEVAMHPDVREVTLARGEAWFRIAHDSARPFIVSAGRIRVRAIGTAFSVRRHEDSADLMVTQGVVEAWTLGGENSRVRVFAGSKAHIAEYQAPEPIEAAGEIERSLAWRDGNIVLEGETLGEGVAEFNRYNTRKLVILDPELAAEKLVGTFHATEPQTFARAVATTLGATVTHNGDTIELSRPGKR